MTDPASPSWYEICSGGDLLQGDLIPNCPVYVPLAAGTEDAEGETLSADLVDVDLVVLTQSCDLEAAKVEVVLGASYQDWPTLREAEDKRGNSAVKGRAFREKLSQGDLPSLFLLNKFDGTPPLDWSVVDFRKPYVVPLSVLKETAGLLEARLRLVSPYREYLAQAFARYMMRVGLPVGPKAFLTEGAE